MALEHFSWRPSLDLLRDSRNGALWLEHWKKRLFYRKALFSSKPKEPWWVIHHILHPDPQPVRVDPELLNNHFTSTSHTC